jgi:murein L,D-transpeptidase YcbB/YkuD
MWENGRKVDEMKVVVGKSETATPMLAAYIKFASVNPYWNVPPELVKNLIGPRVAAQGVSYLTEREYQVLTSYSPGAETIDPHSVDWQAVVDGTQEVRLRRLAVQWAGAQGRQPESGGRGQPAPAGAGLHDVFDRSADRFRRAVLARPLRP